MAEERWEEIGAAVELARTPLAQLTIGRTKIALIHRDGEFGAISGVCNHVGGPLGEGKLDGDYVVCPWHHWKFHCADRPGRARLRGGRGAASTPRGSRTAASTSTSNPRTPRKRKPHEPHPLARRPERHDGPPRVVGISTTAMDAANPRYSTSDALLEHSLAHAAESLGVRDAAAPAQRAQVPPLRGLLLEERAGLHLAVLDHADGSRRPARPRLRGDRALGRRDPGVDADPLGRRRASTSR